MPSVSFAVVYFATAPFSATVFRRVVPSLKDTFPVIVPPYCGVTLADS